MCLRAKALLLVPDVIQHVNRFTRTEEVFWTDVAGMLDLTKDSLREHFVDTDTAWHDPAALDDWGSWCDATAPHMLSDMQHSDADWETVLAYVVTRSHAAVNHVMVAMSRGGVHDHHPSAAWKCSRQWLQGCAQLWG